MNKEIIFERPQREKREKTNFKVHWIFSLEFCILMPEWLFTQKE